MRFDDSLSTVLAADTSSAFGAQSAFRQIVDLVGRGRVSASPALIARLEALRSQVPVSVRAASARALVLARPPAALVQVFALDEPPVAGPVLRRAMLEDAVWEGLLPRLGPAGRAVLRGRTDLSPAVKRALESFGKTDFTIGYAAPAAAASTGSEIAETWSVRAPPPAPEPQPDAALLPELLAAPEIPPSAPPTHGFPIAELVDRIAAFQREPPRPREPEAPATAFSFETDPRGRIVWTDAGARGAIVGLTLAGDLGAAARGLRAIRDGRLTLGAEPLAGDWRIDGDPLFDSDGRYAGLRATAGRINAGEPASGEAIRRLVHELRTPMNAISGFAELMSSEMLGPVPPPHRAAAAAIHAEMAALLGAIEDLDTAARIEGGALDLAPNEVALWPVLAAAGGRDVALHGDRDAVVAADRRILERLLGRFVGMLGNGAAIEVRFDGAWSTVSAANAAEPQTEAPLLGTAFTRRLVADLASELGGRFEVGERLTLRLPARLPGRLGDEVRIGGQR